MTPLYTMDHLKFIVSIRKEESICMQRVNSATVLETKQLGLRLHHSFKTSECADSKISMFAIAFHSSYNVGSFVKCSKVLNTSLSVLN